MACSGAPDRGVAWAVEALWPRGADVRPVGAGSSTTGRRFAVHPGLDEPRLLIPIASPAVGRAALRRTHRGHGLVEQGKRLAAAALGPRAIHGLPMVDVVPHVPGVPESIEERAGKPFHVAITLGPPRWNRKPVLQLIDAAGRTHGYAKVGWNAVSRALLANESTWLRRAAERPATRAPRLIDEHDDEYLDRSIALVEPVDVDRWFRRPVGEPDAELVDAVAGLGRRIEATVADLAWTRDAVDLLDDYRAVDDADGAAELQETIRSALEALAERPVSTAAWHGDLTPWNLLGRGTGRLIDWELAADGVPLGFDVVHFHVQRALELERLDASAAFAVARRRWLPAMRALGIEKEERLTTVWGCYLVEQLRRHAQLVCWGGPTAPSPESAEAGRRLVEMLESRELV